MTSKFDFFDNCIKIVREEEVYGNIYKRICYDPDDDFIEKLDGKEKLSIFSRYINLRKGTIGGLLLDPKKQLRGFSWVGYDSIVKDCSVIEDSEIVGKSIIIGGAYINYSYINNAVINGGIYVNCSTIESDPNNRIKIFSENKENDPFFENYSKQVYFDEDSYKWDNKNIEIRELRLPELYKGMTACLPNDSVLTYNYYVDSSDKSCVKEYICPIDKTHIDIPHLRTSISVCNGYITIMFNYKAVYYNKITSNVNKDYIFDAAMKNINQDIASKEFFVEKEGVTILKNILRNLI
ncbi:MAG: hypothetical protein IKP79_01255 [Bacilli bacterium]|nr:hypothetical protein [Bacilli bacterium]